MELRHLRYFIAVAEELNFSRAAERLLMAQPPLSVAVRQLERELGVTLFVRSSHEVRLTEAGAVLLEGARRTIAEAEAAVRAARRAGAGEIGTLHIGYSWSARYQTLPALGRAFAARSPEVELLTEEMWNGVMPASLRSGAIDLAVALWPEVRPRLRYRLVRRERVIALLGGDHPGAGRDGIALADLGSDQFLLFPRDLAPRLHDFLVALCRRAGFEPRHGRESFHSRWTIGPWDSTTVALAPESVADALPPGIVAVPVVEPPDRFETHLVWRETDPAPAVTAFVGASAGVFPDDAAPTDGPRGAADP